MAGLGQIDMGRLMAAQVLSNLGGNLMAMGGGYAPRGGGGFDIGAIMRLKMAQAEAEREEARRNAATAAMGQWFSQPSDQMKAEPQSVVGPLGPQPPTHQVPMTRAEANPGLAGLARLYPEKFVGKLFDQQFSSAEPKIIKDAEGYQRYATGPKAGERVFPDAQKPPSMTAPTVKDFYEGGKVVQKQGNPRKLKWEEVGQGPRWEPDSATGGKKMTYTERLRSMLAFGKDPDTGESISKQQQDAIRSALAPGSSGPMTKEDFIQDYVLRALQSYKSGPEAYAEAEETWNLIQGVQAGEPPPPEEEESPGLLDRLGNAAAETLGGLLKQAPETPGENVYSEPLPGSTQAAPAQAPSRAPRYQAPGALKPNLKLKADNPATPFTEAELAKLQREDPEQFELLYQYLTQKAGQ